MDIYTVLALLFIAAGCCIFLGFAAGRGFRREDRLKAQARAWDRGFDTGAKSMAQTYRTKTIQRADNPYTAELEKLNAR